MALFIWTGAYDVAATTQHTAPVYALLTVTTKQSIDRRARNIAVPPPAGEAAIARGLPLYRAHCEQCHGAPGIAPQPFALGLTPLPANLQLKARTRTPAQLFWPIKYGLKMTGMPAWEFRLSDGDIWAVVALLGLLPSLSPERYRALTREVTSLAADTALSAERPGTSPDALRGEIALQQYACVTCHEIPGVVGADKAVGPPLAGVGSRRFIAGTLPNTRENMIRWLRAPRAVDPQTAMPELGVSARDARDMAAYLDGLR